jgi:acetyltransferase-like isoleucine patch superfamily enzyme
MISPLVQILLFILPWPLRRRILALFFHYDLAPSSRIGFSIVAVRSLRMERNARIGNFTFIRGLRSLIVGEFAAIGNLNWITGRVEHSVFFAENKTRDSSLTIKRHGAVTHRHLIDCTDSVTIGEFTTLAGWGSQLVTHGIDVATSRQRSAPIEIGSYCLIGTRCILLKGSKLPDYSVLGAGSVLVHAKSETHKIYSGVPAAPVRDLQPACNYFHRKTGAVL